jgi:hypothetical protein
VLGTRALTASKESRRHFLTSAAEVLAHSHVGRDCMGPVHICGRRVHPARSARPVSTNLRALRSLPRVGGPVHARQ